MALSTNDINRLKSLTSSVAQSDRRLLQLQNDTNKEIMNRNRYIEEMNRINNKR